CPPCGWTLIEKSLIRCQNFSDPPKPGNVQCFSIISRRKIGARLIFRFEKPEHSASRSAFCRNSQASLSELAVCHSRAVVSCNSLAILDAFK
ncbi:MAG: hypothetical protein PHC52_08645, partial [Syntrophales bacterium]|nr:hypothetical protein [Syntrophales bacterium]